MMIKNGKEEEGIMNVMWQRYVKPWDEKKEEISNVGYRILNDEVPPGSAQGKEIKNDPSSPLRIKKCKIKNEKIPIDSNQDGAGKMSNVGYPTPGVEINTG